MIGMAIKNFKLVDGIMAGIYAYKCSCHENLNLIYAHIYINHSIFTHPRKKETLFSVQIKVKIYNLNLNLQGRSCCYRCK
jgi:hypothetical protein